MLDPIAHFVERRTQAKSSEPGDIAAMVLATSDGACVSQRTVFVKTLDESGLYFYTNYNSKKSKDILIHPYGSLHCTWQSTGEQFHFKGPIKMTTPEISDAYFQTRPFESQVGAWASQQSEPLESRELLLERYQTLLEQYQGKTVPRPPHWGGYVLVPNTIEVWSAGEHRLHDRYLYTRSNPTDGWAVTRLNP